MYQKKTAVFIGRMQPPTAAHLTIIAIALKKYDEVIVMLGSANASISPQNPFNFETRRSAIEFGLNYPDNLLIYPLNDYPGKDSKWVKQVMDKVKSADVTLIGHKKDQSSYYLNLFPKWKSEDYGGVHHNGELINATDLRVHMFEDNFEDIPDHFFFSRNHRAWVLDEMVHGIFSNNEFEIAKETYHYEKKYKEDTKFVNLPFPPIFTTVDAVVEVSGHILMIKRKNAPGKGMWALPGGYVNANELLDDAVIRELREETHLKVPVKVLRGSQKAKRLFDAPHRSGRGRIITQAYYYKLDASLGFPRIYGDDDAEKAEWLPINQIFEQPRKIFEDHLHIIETMIEA